jgi:hypothetical protein
MPHWPRVRPIRGAISFAASHDPTLRHPIAGRRITIEGAYRPRRLALLPPDFLERSQGCPSSHGNVRFVISLADNTGRCAFGCSRLEPALGRNLFLSGSRSVYVDEKPLAIEKALAHSQSWLSAMRQFIDAVADLQRRILID